MKKLKKVISKVILLIITLNLLANQVVFASNGVENLRKIEYSEEFLEWLQLPEEEREKVLQPRIYDVPDTKVKFKNPFSLVRMLGTGLSTKYTLKDIILNNLIIKNQGNTQACWAFATLSSLETNLALLNNKNGINTSKVYDFSERHLIYSTSKTFLNSIINKDGYNKEASIGGNWFISSSYLTNGSGAIEELDMPFENNENIIDISQIQNKIVTSQVYDTKEFSDTVDKNEIKKHIKAYGSIYAGIHGAKLFAGDCYNNSTGAIFCNDSSTYPVDHAVSIIGWDDNYAKENFNAALRPKSDGAWIIRNSWGEFISEDLSEIKSSIYEADPTGCKENGWNSAEEIPNKIIIDMYEKTFGEGRVTIDTEENILKGEVGDKGYMYISYEDCNIYTTLWGIIKSSDKVSYDNIYQYDKYFAAGALGVSDVNSKIMLYNIFDKQTSGTEYLTQISLYAPETYTCKVYVNPNGTSVAKSDLQLVSLEAGETETFDAGYHTLEFAEPIKINANNFVVLVEIQGTRDVIEVRLEAKINGLAMFDVVEVEDGKCFIAEGHDLENCTWLDLSKLNQMSSALTSGDSTIKAFTVSEIIDDSLKNIEITTLPTKTTYFEGENFDPTGMVVTAYYNDGTSATIDGSSYGIVNGTNLVEGQTSVTITYENKTIDQAISVEKNTITKLEIITPPNKTTYIEGESFDPTGMVVKATYKDTNIKIITDYTIVDGNNLKNNQTKVTISYEGKETEQSIKVTPNELIEIKITKEPSKTEYVVGQNFDKAGMIVTGIYKNGANVEILDYIIQNGKNLSLEQTSVVIKYEDKTVLQPITVVEKAITGITIEKMPVKQKYIQNKENLDLTGGILKVTYNDGSTENIEMTSDEVTATNFENKNLGKINVTLTYQSKTVMLEVEIIEEEKAENSNFENVKSNLKKVKAYYFTDNPEKDYILIELEINKIIRNLKNDKTEYYYYLSSNKNEENITDWTKITEEQNSSDKLQFTIDSRKITNYDKIANENVIYLYIKEVAVKGGNQSVAISKAINIDTDVEIETYVNNAKKDLTQSGNDNKKDNTLSPGNIPNAGTTITVLIVIIATFCIGLILYSKYKNLSKYIK